MKLALASGLLAIALAGVAPAATLTAIDPTDTTAFVSATTLFTTEMKRDENVENNGQRGHDVFLRNAGTFNSAHSFGLDWAASGTVYAWSLAYDGDKATLTFGGVSRTMDVALDGVWNALGFSIRADDMTRFLSSTALVTLSSVNGSAISGGMVLSATDGLAGGTLALSGLGPISSVSGTLAFSFTTAPGAKGSPNGRLAVTLSAVEVEPVVPAPIPVPAAFPLLMLGLGALVAVARRRQH